MELFKGAIHLLDGRLKVTRPGQDFEPAFGNAVATRQWLQDPFAANDPAPVDVEPASVEPATQSAA